MDAGQIQQALTNLVVNGLQAMKRPGTLWVRLGHVRALPPADLGGPEAEWVRLDVVDEGERASSPRPWPVCSSPSSPPRTRGGDGPRPGRIRRNRRGSRGTDRGEKRARRGSWFSVYLPWRPAGHRSPEREHDEGAHPGGGGRARDAHPVGERAGAPRVPPHGARPPRTRPRVRWSGGLRPRPGGPADAGDGRARAVRAHGAQPSGTRWWC